MGLPIAIMLPSSCLFVEVTRGRHFLMFGAEMVSVLIANQG